MERYAAGDVGAFEELYGRYERSLYGFCLRYLGDPDAAADAFQDVLKHVVDARDVYEPRGRFRSWIFTIARRICVDSVRQARSTALFDARAGVPAEQITGVEPGFEERVAELDEIQLLLRSLPREQREALLLSKYEGFSYAEIAAMIGSTEAGVKQKVYRALRTLRAQPAS